MNKHLLDCLLEDDIERIKKRFVDDYDIKGDERARFDRARALVLGYRIALEQTGFEAYANEWGEDHLLPLFEPPKPTKREQIEKAIEKLQKELSEIVGEE